jgi:hypothetical protein
MPRPFRVRYSLSHPDRHEILDPRLGEMMKRPLHRVGTRPTVANPLTASAKEVLEQIDRWDERLDLLRRGQYLTAMNAPEVPGWLTARARFGDVVGMGDASYVPYEFEGAPRVSTERRALRSAHPHRLLGRHRAAQGNSTGPAVG